MNIYLGTLIASLLINSSKIKGKTMTVSRKFKLAVTFLMFVNFSISFAETASSIFQKHSPRIVYIETKQGSMGTGYLLTDNWILTNRHVVYGQNKESKLWDGPKRFIFANNKELKNFHSIDCSKRVDICLIYIPSVTRKFHAPWQPRSVKAGEDVFVIGHPSGIGVPVISTGIVSSQQSFFPGKDIFEKPDHFEGFTTNAAISHGSSGSPIFSKKGELIGIVVASYKESQNLNLAISVTELVKLMKGKESVTLTPGFADRLNQQLRLTEVVRLPNPRNDPNFDRNTKFCHYTNSGNLSYCYFFERECVEKQEEEDSGKCYQVSL